MKRCDVVRLGLITGMLVMLAGSAALAKEAFFNSNAVTGKIVRQDTVYLWNGHSLDHLDFVWVKPVAKPSDLYKIESGAIFFPAQAKGYLRSKTEYKNFRLHVEWSWPLSTEHGNSGVLLYTQKPDSVWPECIQVQLKADNAGDLIAMQKAKFKELKGHSNQVVPKFAKSNEKPMGQWNSCDVICKGRTMKVYINGKLQNKATHINLKKGYVGFQMEGKPIGFRNIYLIKDGK